MGRLDKETFVCLDCETTGLDPEEDRVIEVAAVRFNLDGIMEQFDSLIDPERLISAESMAIHHITDDMVKGKPKIAEVLPELLKLMGSDIIVGHGIGFDIALIVNAARRASVPCNLAKNKSLDTLRMARLYGGSPVNSLDQLRQHFNVSYEGTHRALSDVIVNVEVFKHLARDFKNTEDLFQALSKPVMLKNMPLGKHKGRPIKEVPIEYLHWAANKDFDQDLLFSLRSEINRRKKGNLFTQSSNPFSKL